MLEPFAELIGGRNAALRSSFVMAIFMGTTILRTVMQVGQLCEEDRGIVRRKLEQLFEEALCEAEQRREAIDIKEVEARAGVEHEFKDVQSTGDRKKEGKA